MVLKTNFLLGSFTGMIQLLMLVFHLCPGAMGYSIAKYRGHPSTLTCPVKDSNPHPLLAKQALYH